jgi:ribosomal protein L11 methyltransferase
MSRLETLSLTVPEEFLEIFEAALLSVCPTVGFFRDDDEGPWILEAVKERGADEAELQDALALAGAASGWEAELRRSATEADGWLARNLATFPEQFVGRRFAIRGTHVATPPIAGRITLVLDAGMAFGSGEHGSTRSCLRALEFVAWHKPSRILDLGTGTGVLALAAARLLHRRVVAADIDPWSVRNARDNAARNRLAPFVRVGRADGWRSAWIRRAGPYDLVLANILARPLCAMAPDLARHLAPGGQAILSGLLVRQVPWVARVHRVQGLVLVDVVRDGNWAALVVRRPFS